MMSHNAPATASATPVQVLGYLAEFDDPHLLLHACEKVRDAGYTHWDAHTPFPVHGLNDAMGLKPSKLPYLVLGGGVTGLGLALLMQYWMNVLDYPYLISGKPLFSVPANIPVIFELTVLLSAFAAFFGMLAINGLPRYHHPVFYSARISRATDDRFFISIDARDPKFEREATGQLIAGLGALNFELLEAHDGA
jgi:hypothetical protein